MAIQLPRMLKNMALFIDGRGYAGRVDELTLPTLAVSTEEHRAGGMDAPVNLDMGMEALEATFTLSDFDEEVFAQFGLIANNDLPVTVRGAIQAQGSGQAQPVVANLRGGWSSLDPGTWQPGSKNTLTATMAVRFYKLTINGREVVEIDIPNMIRRIDGVDQLAQQREHLGL